MTQTFPAFLFQDYDYDDADGILRLRYGYEGGASFEEVITFTGVRRTLSEAERSALDGVFRQVHFAAGISYYKAFVPQTLKLASGHFSADEARFFENFYLQGLGEFAVENGLDLRGHMQFSHDEHAPTAQASTISLPRKSAVPIGGGKDSVVTLEIMKAAGEAIVPLCINATQPMLDCLEVSGLDEAIHIRRQLDPGLFALNDQGAYNGHVPITGILSFIMVAAGLIYGFDRLAFSNERSANEGNMTMGDLEINHQYSKSYAFEHDFNAYVQTHLLSGFDYFSFLRPLSELGIARLFAQYPAYFPAFKSCNRNFHIDQQKRQHGWCGDCPKCRFVFLALAPFIDREALINIFGKNLFEDESQLDGYRELLGIAGHKPFECVGEINECRTALRALAGQDKWANDKLVIRLMAELGHPPVADKTELTAEVTTLLPPHNLSDHYWKMLNAAVNA